MVVLLASLAAPVALLWQHSDVFLTEHCAENVISADHRDLDQADLTQQDNFRRMNIPIPETFPKQKHTYYDSREDNALTSTITRTHTKPNSQSEKT